MSDERTPVVLDPLEHDPVAYEQHEDKMPSAPPAGSVLALLDADVQADMDESTVILPVGRSSRLCARYRPLTDQEAEKLSRLAEKAVADARKKKTSDEDDEADSEGVKLAALTLVMGCVELLWKDDPAAEPAETTVRPLVDVLAEQGVDTRGSAPLRFDRRFAEVRGLQIPSPVNSVDVVLELHRWRFGRDGKSNLAPLGHAMTAYQRFASSTRQAAEDRVLGES